VLLGDPVVRSRSPAIHHAAFRATGVDGRYEARAVDRAGLERAIAEIRSGSIDGANVTMPHKVRAAELVEDLSDEAGLAGAVNTISANAGRLMGANTDVLAIGAALQGFIGPVLILGAGGAAAGAAAAAAGRDAWVSARSPSAARRMADRFGLETVEWGEPVEGGTVINATPLGMNAEPLPPGLVESAGGLIDLAYDDDPTPAVAAARRLGLPVIEGIDLLVAQAAESFTIWTGLEAPLEAMMRAARGR
jgi:shikimate dehydrogenase